MRDPKALRILLNAYWSSAGWKRGAVLSSADHAYAREAGYWFDPVHLSHAEMTQWVERSVQAASPQRIADAFLASLSTRQLELRSALGSYAVARNFPLHPFQSGRGASCEICGGYDSTRAPYDFSILNFERYQWGGVRHAHPEYIAFDLEQFNKLEFNPPGEPDLKIMRQILAVIQGCEAQAGPRDLEKRLAKVVVSNKAEREVLIQILAYCGILQPRDQASYFQSFVPAARRTLPPVHKIDWTYPVCWWRGSDGINLDALRDYFPALV